MHCLQKRNTTITLMLALEVSEEELTKRLLLRGKDSGRADDRNTDIIKKELMNITAKQQLLPSIIKHRINLKE